MEQTPLPAALSGFSAPIILYGCQNWSLLPTTIPNGIPNTSSYHLIRVLDGQFLFNGEKLQPGACLLIPPRCKDVLRVPEGGQAQSLTFIVEGRKLQALGEDGGSALALASGAPRQPSPEQWWGVQLGPILSQAAQDNVRKSLPRILDAWWRAPLERLRANSWLGLLLVDVVADSLDQEGYLGAFKLPPDLPRKSPRFVSACHRRGRCGGYRSWRNSRIPGSM